MTVVDQIIWARWIVPVVPHECVLENHGIAIRNGKIEAIVAPGAEERFEARKQVHLDQHVVIPGLVNAHTHAAMVFLRGVGDDMELMPWLEEKIWPLERRLVTAQFVADGTRQAIAEMIRGGTTTAKDQYFFPEEALRVAREAGFRLMAGLPLIEFPTPWGDGPDDYLAKGDALLREWANDSLVSLSLSPHAPYSVSDDTFSRGKRLTDKYGVLMDVHVHETAGEVERAVAEHSERPVARLQRLGVLDERFLAVHMTAVNEADMEHVARAGASIAHCPESNLKLASGFCPVAALQQAGINVAIGTDGAASNNDLDMLSEMRTAGLLAKAVSQNPRALPAARALEVATLGGAKALGLADKIGSIEVGKQADLCALSMQDIEMRPLFNVISQIVYAAARHQVTDVWIDGAAVLRDRGLRTLDEERLLDRARYWNKEIRDE